MPIRSKANIARDFKAWLEARLRIVDTGSGTLLSALVLEALAGSLATAYSDLGGAQTAQGLSDPDSVDKTDLDDIAYNLNITRKPAARATGFITFRRTTAPTASIQIGNETGTGGVLLTTTRDSTGAFVTFETTSTVFFTTSTTADPETGLYEVSAPIRAIGPGTSGNKAAGAIKTLQSPVSGVSSVTNKVASTGGKNEESNDELALRLGAKLLGFQPGILEGMRTIVLAQAGAQDASVVGPDDSEFQRSPVGSVDLVIKGSNLTTAVDQIKFVDSSPVTLEKRPATEINSVVSTVGLTQTTLTKNSQYVFNQDAVSEERYSNQANDHLSWLGTSLPNSGADVIITYTYDALIPEMQNVLDQRNKHYPAAKLLVKRGQAVNIDMTFTVKRTTSIDTQGLKNNLSTALTNYISSLGLGSTVKQSNLVVVIKDVSGAGTVTLPFTKLSRRGEGGTSDISLTKYEYPQLDSQSLSITVTD